MSSKNISSKNISSKNISSINISSVSNSLDFILNDNIPITDEYSIKLVTDRNERSIRHIRIE